MPLHNWGLLFHNRVWDIKQIILEHLRSDYTSIPIPQGQKSLYAKQPHMLMINWPKYDKEKLNCAQI